MSDLPPSVPLAAEIDRLRAENAELWDALSGLVEYWTVGKARLGVLNKASAILAKTAKEEK